MFSSCDKAKADVATRYKNKKIAHFSTNKGISDISVCRETNPIVSSVKGKIIDQEYYSVNKYIVTNKVIIGNPVLSSIRNKKSNRVNLARKQASVPTTGNRAKGQIKRNKWTNHQRDKRTNI